MSDAAALMDRMYRRQRHIYDLSRKFYLLGRDEAIAAPSPRSRRQGAGDRLRHRAQSRQTGAGLSRGAALRPRRIAGNAGDRGGVDRARRARLAHRAWPRRTPRRSTRAAMFGCASFERVMISYALSMIPPWREALGPSARCCRARRIAADRRFRRLRRVARPVQGRIAPLARRLRRDSARRSRRRARGAGRRARHDMRDREPVSRLRGPGGCAATVPDRGAHPPNARDRVKINSPTRPPTSVPLMRIYCRSLPTCSSRRLTSVAVSQLSTTAAI